MAAMADETCRICRSEGTAEEPLYHPCKCSGSIKYVHQDCLMEWLQHSQKKHCELCKTNFRFTKAPGLLGLVGPDIASTIVVQDAVPSNTTAQQERISEYLLQSATFKGLANLTSSTQINQILVDTFEGQIITILVVLAFILIFLIREWVVQQQPPQALDGNGQPVQQQDPRFEELLAEVERHRARREANGPGDAADPQAPGPQPMFGSDDEVEEEDNSSEESVFGGNDSELSFQAGRNEESDGEMPFHFEEPAKVDTTGLLPGTRLSIQDHLQSEAEPQIKSDISFDLKGLTEPSYYDNEASTSAVPTQENRPLFQIRKRTSIHQIDTTSTDIPSEEPAFSFRPASPAVPFQFGSSTRPLQPDPTSSNETLKRPQISRELSAQSAELRRKLEEQKRSDPQLPSEYQLPDPPRILSRYIEEETPDDASEDQSPNPPAPETSFQTTDTRHVESVEQGPTATESNPMPVPNSYNFDLSSSGSDFNWNKYTEYAQKAEKSTSGKAGSAIMGTRESSSGSDGSRKRASDMSWEELVEMKEQTSNSPSSDDLQQVTAFDDVVSSDDDDADFHDQVQREILARAAERYGDIDGRLGDRIRNTDPITVAEMANLVRESHANQTNDPNQEQAAEPEQEPEPETHVDEEVANGNNMEMTTSKSMLMTSTGSWNSLACGAH
ncbi:hypothetical protein ABW21_db0202356 [Orbilia brochopaga]|nr:hypothetical protein ABW21_db0202356 [Drechslerella brochopaga]